MIKKLLHKLFKYDPIDEGEYMERWWVLGDRDSKERVRARLHNIKRSDAGRDLHDHPWDYLTVILKGGYWEHTEIPFREWVDSPWETYEENFRYYRRRWYGPGTVLFRKAAEKHRLEVPPGKSTWTLFITAKKSREWGFWPNGRFVHWTNYERKA